MKKEIPIGLAIGAVVVLVLIVVGLLWRSQMVPDRHTSLRGPDGKRHFPHPAGTGGGGTGAGGPN